MELKDIIKAGRTAKKLTQEKLADLVNVSSTHIQHIESGERNPSIPLLIDLANVLELSLDAWLCFPKNSDSSIERAKALISLLQPRDLNILIATMEAMIREN